jgi:hypothetical protein
MKFLNKVKSVRSVAGYRVALVFDDGYIAELDLEPMCSRGPIFEPLRDPAFFAQVGVADWGVIFWPNDADIDSDVLRFWCEQGRVCSRDETNAYFEQAFLKTAALEE